MYGYELMIKILRRFFTTTYITNYELANYRVFLYFLFLVKRNLHFYNLAFSSCSHTEFVYTLCFDVTILLIF